MNVEARFWQKVLKLSVEECWPWQAYRDAAGYGAFRFKGRIRKAHQVAYLLAYGDFDGKHVLHKCDHPWCVNPAHLFLGTNKENIYDSLAKGRFNRNKARGERQHSAKLTAKEVAEIRQRYVPHVYGKRRLANDFNVSRHCIAAVLGLGKVRRSWCHV